MPVTINASPTNGLVQTADGSGVMKLQSNGVTTNALAWIRYNPATPAIVAAYNVSSVTKNTTGDYTFNFTNALTDANYTAVASVGDTGATAGSSALGGMLTKTITTTSLRSLFGYGNTMAANDWPQTCVVIFGN